MSQPVKVSDNLVLAARLTGELAERSIAGQIEFWAKLGRAVEGLLPGRQVLGLCGAKPRKLLSACLDSVDSPEGRKRVKTVLRAQPYPHYQAASGHPGLLLRIEEDGTRALGRFVNREFRVIKRLRG